MFLRAVLACSKYSSLRDEQHALDSPPPDQRRLAVVMVERAAPSSTSLSSKAKFLDPRTPCLGAYRGEEVVAGALATAAGLGTDTAVLVVFGVLLALLAAQPARLGTGVQRSLLHLRVEGRLAREDLAGRITHIGTVKVEADAPGQHLHVLLTQAGVGAGGAGLGAVGAGLDALDPRFCVHCGATRVRLDYPSGLSHAPAPF